MKKILLMLIGVLMALPMAARDFTYTYEGQTLTYTVLNETAKTVETKQGHKTSYGWVAGNSVSGNLILPSHPMDGETEYTLVSIGMDSFYKLTGLTSVIIPNSVTNIDNYAFNGCTGLIKSAYPNTIYNPFSYGICVAYEPKDALIEDGFIWGPDKTDLRFVPYYIKGEYEIPETVTSIGSYAFSGCYGLTSVIIPNSVTSIDEGAFFDCSGLTSVTIPNSVKSIGASAFSGCSGLTSVTIGNSVTSIDEGAFFDCSGLTSVTIPNSVKSIGASAFSGCTGLTSVTIEDGEEPISIASDAFKNAPISSLYIGHYWTGSLDFSSTLEMLTFGNNITVIHDNKFKNYSKLASVTIPNSVTEIGNYAFNYCSGLTSVTIPNSVTSIGSYAFSGCSGLTSVTIGNSVTSIGYQAFNGCTGLIKSAYPNTISNPFFDYGIRLAYDPEGVITEDGFIWGPDKTDLRFVPCYIKGEYEIPETVTSIENWAFSKCTGLTSVIIPNSVSEIGKSAFQYCSRLTKAEFASIESLCSIKFGDSSANPLSYANHLYLNGEEVTEVVIPVSVTSIGNYAFEGARYLTSVTIPNSVTKIGNYAFNYCSGLTSVTIPNSVTSIGSYAFSGCSGLTSVTIPNSVTSIGYSAFSGCTGLTSVTIPNSVTEIGNYAFNYCTGLTTVIIGNSVTSISYEAFDGCTGLIKSAYPNTITNPFSKGISIAYEPKDALIEDGFIWGPDKTDLRFVPYYIKGEYEIPETVNSIGGSAFYGCTGLTSVTIPNSVTSIDEKSFYNCSGLTSVTIGNSVNSIGENAFYGCSGLTSVTIPNSVTSIGSSAFSRCSGVKEVYFNAENCTSCGAYKYPAFPSQIESVTFGEKVKTIPSYSFQGCTGLTSVTIPNSVTEIGENAFSGCTGLITVISHSKTAPKINTNSFEGLYETTEAIVPDNCLSDYLNSNWSLFSNLKTGSGTVATPFTDDVFKFRVAGEKAAVLIPGNYSAMTSVSIPERVVFDDKFYYVTAIGVNAFKNCKNITTIVFPKRLEEIWESAFEGANVSVSELSFPSTLEKIYDNAFKNCTGISKVTLPEKLSYLGDYSFSGSSLSNINIPVAAGKGCFEGTKNLTTIRLSEKVDSIAASTFMGCEMLNNFTLPQALQRIGSSAFSGCSTLTSVRLGNKVTSIGDNAFNGCTGLTSFKIPDSVNALGSGAFSGCTGLASVVIGNSVPSIGDEAFYNCDKLLLVDIPNSVTSLGASAFSGCSGMTSVKLGDAVSTIGDEAFYNCSGMTSVKFGDAVSTIGTSAFSGCNKLTVLEIPNSVTTLGASSFSGCSGLQTVTIGNSLTEIDGTVFDGCTSVNLLKLTYSDSPIQLAASFTGGIKTLFMGRNITGVSTGAFANLNTLYVDDLMENLRADAFKNSTNLQEVYLGRALNEIGSNAFSGCTGLTYVEIPNNVKTIGASAFSGCSGVSAVTFGSSVESVENNAFDGCGLTDLVLSPATVTIGDNAFNGNNLKNIAIGAYVTRIGANAFNGSNSLQGVSITAVDPPSAENNTFSYYGCPLYVTPSDNDAVKDAYYNFTRCWYRFSGYDLIPIDKVHVENEGTLNLKPGQTIKLTATFTPANASLPYIFWRSTNPDIATVDKDGNVKLTEHNSDIQTYAEEAESCEIVAETLYSNGPVASVKINAEASGIEDIVEDQPAAVTVQNNDIYTMTGVCLKRNATDDDIRALSPGFYIIRGKKVLIK